jgi:hypothetical protein
MPENFSKLNSEDSSANSSSKSAGSKLKVSFESIAKELDKKGSAAGFRRLRNFLLTNFHTLKSEFSPLGLMNLVISCDKHAVFAEMSEEKTKKDDQIRWKLFQDYLAGKMDKFEPTGVEVDDGEAEPISKDE